MLDDLTTFLESVEPLLNGFKERAGKVREILHDPSTTFLIVTTPDPLTLSEARYLEERLIKEDVNCGGYVVNRVHAPVLKEGEHLPSVEPLADELREIPGSSYIGRKRLGRLAHQMLRNAKDFDTLGAKDAEMLADLGSRHGAPVFPIPFYSRDIYSLPGLNRVRADLFDDHGRAD
jgi:anion-transporting  ArsA/GET3 family ATPase